MIKIEDFVAPDTFKKMMSFAESEQQTPFVMIDLDTISRAYDELIKAFPEAYVYFAVKANPAIEITQLLHNKGSCFDIASVYELDKVMSVGVPPEHISFGNTIKKPQAIKYFYDKGVRLFATDSLYDLNNIAQHAPGSKVYCRILVDEVANADWPLSKKFGCTRTMAYHLLVEARKLGLIPYGVSFHVGSQQRSQCAWKMAIEKAAALFQQLEKDHGIHLDLLNLGGGLPANYVIATDSLQQYASYINRSLDETFPPGSPSRPSKIIIEPGRSLVGNSGILVSEVVLASRKGVYDDDQIQHAHDDDNINDDNTNFFKTTVTGESDEDLSVEKDKSLVNNGTKWVFIDCGIFGGMMECLDEAVKYPIVAQRRNSPNTHLMCSCDALQQKALLDEATANKLSLKNEDANFNSAASTSAATCTSSDSDSDDASPAFWRHNGMAQHSVERENSIIAGPTCDSTDVLYKRNKYNLPADIQQGDRLFFLTTGAYTTSYSCVEFNGFPPLKTFCF